MKIAVTAKGATPEAEVDSRFGRCAYFIIANTETDEFEALDNDNTMAGGGAGVSTAQMIAGKGVEAILTGNCGPKAYDVLAAAGVKVITGVSGRVKDAIEAYKQDKYSVAGQPNVADHYGKS